MRKINIYGSTGIIGNKTLKLIKNYFLDIQVHLLLANSNHKKLIKQVYEYKPKYVCLLNKKIQKKFIKDIKDLNVKVINPENILDFISNTKSDLSLLSISGISALKFIEPILKNTNILGLVNKECIVSGGHLFKNLFKKNKAIVVPLDSEHFSLFNYFRSTDTNYKNINQIYLTASGGPFLGLKKNQLQNIKYKDVVKHPIWKMGYKNSIDSATMANKCLEVIEAKYLFNFDFQLLKILIHPEALVHSIIEYKNFTSTLNYFYHDMDIPIINFLNFYKKNKIILQKNDYNFNKDSSLNFYQTNNKFFPILDIFHQIEKKPQNLIKFNVANEFAVNLFANNKIKYHEISKIIEKCLYIEFDYLVNNVKNVLLFEENYLEKINNEFNL